MELFREDQWKKIYQFLRIEGASRRIYTGTEANCKAFFTAILWMTRSGSQWRLLPKELGEWNTIYKRFARWSDQGVFSRMFEYFKDDPDMTTTLMVDSTIVRTHASCTGLRLLKKAS
ncbi:MAG: hypothetical protein A3E87_04245 [Gammaproteobacteria bacterium RIFCSPHIGHO2_12_FULL_35_23]|nr:MAG: hypothetical protein A3E87_04245 [Gammaproteobacteria bacterium RIFCSPHIGHO2_12_FULL_35_23]